MITEAKLDEWKQLARRDDCFTAHDAFVPSDIRQMLGEIERLHTIVRKAKEWVANAKEHGVDL